MLRRPLARLVLGVPREKESKRTTSLEEAAAAAVGSLEALFEDGPGGSSTLRHHSVVARELREKGQQCTLLTSCLLRQRLLHTPSRTAVFQPADWQAGWQASFPDGGCKRRCLGREPASEARLFLTLDSRGLGGAGKVGPTNYQPAAHKWPVGRMFETPGA